MQIKMFLFCVDIDIKLATDKILQAFQIYISKYQVIGFTKFFKKATILKASCLDGINFRRHTKLALIEYVFRM